MPDNNLPSEKKSFVELFKASFKRRMALSIAHDMVNSTALDKYRALAYAVRDQNLSKWLKTQETYYQKNPKRIYYLSLEYLMGRTLKNNLLNLGIDIQVDQALEEMGFSLEDISELEPDAGLGNGGLGRLAACFIDSMATMELPAYAYGIRYEYGMFMQTLKELQQQEHPDNWLRYGNPWEIARAEAEYKVHFFGKVKTYRDRDGKKISAWIETEEIIALGYDVPVPGYDSNTVNTLKLWAANSSQDFNLQTFNAGDYINAIIEKHNSETISKVLYPNDQNYEGKTLRLEQQYFMVCASLQDILKRLEKCGDDLRDLPIKAAIHLNDTHPSIAIVELMRILVDIHYMGWDEAWDITTKTFAYTNHTVLPEALEKWPVELFEKVLPRHLQIIYEINRKFLELVQALHPGDHNRFERMSIIEENNPKNVRMANLAIIGSFSVNGVAALHTKILQEGIFKDFYEVFPDKFNNKTNGITPRRWLKHCNKRLSDLITSKIGNNWVKNLFELKKLEEFANDKSFLDDWDQVKQENKKVLAEVIKKSCHIQVNVNSIFDVQVKRIHEYKRQLLNILHVITLYNRIKSGQSDNFVPRTVIFGGKAAPGYQRAKDIIHLINCVANLINRDRLTRNLLNVAFIPNYGVSIAEKIFPGSDLSEQISTAGMEASGTGNMKFALNGALTIGTLDGANVEIMEEVGQENIFIFGKTEAQITEMKHNEYNPQHYYENDSELKQVMNQIRDGYFSPIQPDLFKPLFNDLIYHGDPFFVLADYRSYVNCQAKVDEAYNDKNKWLEMAILNVARMGKFSSDRVIQEYADEIWDISSCPVNSE
jgi:glycogen phosphorylase